MGLCVIRAKARVLVCSDSADVRWSICSQSRPASVEEVKNAQIKTSWFDEGYADCSDSSFYNPHIINSCDALKARKMMEMQRLKREKRGLKEAANKQVFGNCSASVTETKKVSHIYSQLCWVLCKWEINVISTAGLQTHICSLLLPFHQEIIVLLQQCWSSALSNYSYTIMHICIYSTFHEGLRLFF